MSTLVVVLSALGWLATAASSLAAEPPPLEYQVKAAFLAKFAPFVQWPAAAFQGGRPLTICVAGPNPFGSALDALADAGVGDLPVVTRRVSVPAEGRACHILYVRRSAALSTGAVLAAVRGFPVLTVTDAADGAGPAGVLHFVVADNRVRFQVDADAAERNGLQISSKLRSLALPSGSGR